MEIVFKIVNSSEFFQSVPRYCNARETWANIQLINSGLILFKKGYMQLKEMNQAVKAFSIAAKDTKVGERIPLDAGEINKALRILDKCMGELIINTWIERTSHMLECNKSNL